MAIPTPSFAKIRLVILFIAFVVFCFVIGMVKNSFADYPGECTKTLYTITDTGSAKSWMYGGWQETYTAPTFITRTGWNYVDATRPYEIIALSHYYYTGNGWARVWGPYSGMFADGSRGPGEIYTGNIQDKLDTLVCGDPCETQKNSLKAACGGDENVDWSNWSDETCSGGECKKKCDGQGEETVQEAMARCAALEKAYSHYDYTICRGICGCSESQYNQGKESCGVYGIRDFNEITCQPICNGCEDKWNEAQALCGNKFVESWECDNATGKIINLKCMNEPPKAVPGEDGTPAAPDPTPAPDDKDPEPDTPDNPDDPSDAKLAAIHSELQKIVLQNNDRKNQLNEATNSLNWIGENNRRIVDNTKIIGDSINGMGDDISSGIKDGLGGLQDSIDGVGDDIDELTTTLNDISSGDYSSPGEEDPYTAEAYDFSERTSEFLDQMKTTGIFSLPGMLSDSIPGGGSPTLTIDTGETFGGIHTVDFSNFSTALTILRYLFQIAGMVLAIRIVTLKR